IQIVAVSPDPVEVDRQRNASAADGLHTEEVADIGRGIGGHFDTELIQTRLQKLRRAARAHEPVQVIGPGFPDVPKIARRPADSPKTEKDQRYAQALAACSDIAPDDVAKQSIGNENQHK